MFLLGVSTAADYLQRTLSHSALTCLDITTFEAVGGEKLCTDIIDGVS